MKLFLATFVYIPNLKIASNMANTLKIKGSTYKPARDIITLRVKQYAEYHFHRALSNLKLEQRQIIVYCLQDRFQFSVNEITSLLSISVSTCYRDMHAGYVYNISSKSFVDKVSDIESYILYNAKYRN